MSLGSGVPSFKHIPGTEFVVDVFKPQPWIKAYWLTHAHSGNAGDDASRAWRERGIG